jgi:uncharacterized protein (DUF433 family)
MNLPDYLTQDSHGYIHLAGHRVGLRHVVELYQENYTPEMLHEHFPTVSLPIIEKVITFYLANQAEIDDYVSASQLAVDQLAAVPQAGPSAAELRHRMTTKRNLESA